METICMKCQVIVWMSRNRDNYRPYKPRMTDNTQATDQRKAKQTGPEVIKLFLCSIQLSMKFSLLINMKMSTIVDIFIFISIEIFTLSYVQQERIGN